MNYDNFLLALNQIREVLIKLFDPSISNSEIRSAISVIKSKFWASGSGIKNVSKFEEAFKQYVKSKSCVALSNGTAALHLALSLFDIKNKQVLIPSLTFVSTAHAVKYNEGIPVFVDIDPKTMCIDIDDVKKKISRRVAAIVPVHFAGMPCNLREIKSVADSYDIPIIEDAAHAVGSSYNKRKIGSHSEAVCFSFHPVKNLAMPTGGAICLNGQNHSKNKTILNASRWCGIGDRQGPDYDILRLGWNYYMNEISAAIGIVQLKKLERLNRFRQKNSKRYFNELDLEYKMPYSDNCSYHFYWIRVKRRKQFMKKMMERGIETGIHYHPVHMTSYYKIGRSLHITEKIGKEIVSIPTHPDLSDENVDKIIRVINQIT